MSRHLWARPFSVIAIAAALCFGGSAAFAQSTYQAIDLSFPGNFGTSATAIGGGQAAGYEIYNGTLRTTSCMRSIGPPEVRRST
jgi:hypothetical protein